MNLASVFVKATLCYPKREAVQFLDQSYSYEYLSTEITQTIQGLQSLGVKQGSRVALLLPNSHYYLIFYVATLSLGATLVNLNPLYHQEELLHLIQDSQPDILVTLDVRTLFNKARYLKKNQIKPFQVIIASLKAALPRKKQYLASLFKPFYFVPSFLYGSAISFRSLKAKTDPSLPIEPLVLMPNTIALIQYTGGTTGVAKGAMLSHQNLLSNTKQIASWLQTIDSNYHAEKYYKLVAVLPFFHIFSLTTILNLSLYLKGQMILLPQFDLKDFVDSIATYRPNLLMGVPTLFTKIAHEENLDPDLFSSLEYCISGGSALSNETKTLFEEKFHCPLIEGYGLTEASPVITCGTLNTPSGSVGQALPETQINILKSSKKKHNLKTSSSHEAGEICIQGPQVMQGYLNLTEATEETLKDGCLLTGDIGYLDEDGFLYIVDRSKDIIIFNAFNLYPSQIEKIIQVHPSILESAVVAQADALHGEIPIAFVSLKPGKSLSEKALLKMLKEHLSSIEIPHHVIFCKEIPKTTIGKPDRKALRKRLST